MILYKIKPLSRVVFFFHGSVSVQVFGTLVWTEYKLDLNISFIFNDDSSTEDDS